MNRDSGQTFRLLLAGTLILLSACGHDTATGPLAPSPSPGEVISAAGNLELTFTADEACTALPDIARARTYLTSSKVSSTPFALTGATFGRSTSPNYGSWNVIYSRASDHSVEWWFQDPPIWELLGSDAYVTVFGGPTFIDLAAGGELKTGEWPFWGHFTYCAALEEDDYPECEVPVVTCESEHHRLRVVRR